MDEGGLPQQILNWTPTGRRKRGRPKSKWKEGVIRVMAKCGLRELDWETDFVGDWVSKDVIRQRTTYILDFM
jgi:hypothetical protein